MIGVCAAVFVSPEVAFVGMYAIVPPLQKKGLGIKLWTKTMEHVSRKNAGLYAVPEQLATYRDKAGFKVEDSKRMMVFETEAPLHVENLVQNLGNVVIVPIDNPDIEEQVVAYDATIAKYSRGQLLTAIFRERTSIAMAALDKFDRKVNNTCTHCLE